MVSPTLERFLNESLTVHYNRAHVYTHAHAEMLDRKNLAQVKKSHNETRLVLSTHTHTHTSLLMVDGRVYRLLHRQSQANC